MEGCQAFRQPGEGSEGLLAGLLQMAMAWEPWRSSCLQMALSSPAPVQMGVPPAWGWLHQAR